jgi:hypothetical protein
MLTGSHLPPNHRSTDPVLDPIQLCDLAMLRAALLSVHLRETGHPAEALAADNLGSLVERLQSVLARGRLP